MACNSVNFDEVAMKTTTTTCTTYNSSGGVTGNYSYTNQDGYEGDSGRGVCIPGYYRRVRAGELLPFTPWVRSHHEVLSNTRHPFRLKKTTDETGDYWSDWVRNVSDSSPAWGGVKDWVADLQREGGPLLIAAAANAYGKGSYDLGTFLGELPDTFRMLGSTVQRFRDIKNKKRIPNRPQDFLLEARYGWSPLYKDLKSLARQVAKQEKAITRVSGYARETISSSRDAARVTWGDGRFTAYADSHDDITIETNAHVTADYLQTRWKLNPFVTGYELIPYSFVVDWFYDIGKAIQSASLQLGATALTSSVGTKVTHTRTHTKVYSANYGWTFTTAPSTAPFITQSVFWSRTPSNVPYLPSFKPRLDGQKIADLLAMISQFKIVKKILLTKKS